MLGPPVSSRSSPEINNLARALYGRFKTARGKSEAAEEQWKKVDSGAVKFASKYETKAKMLAAFILDPSLGERYMQVTWTIHWNEDMSREVTWMTEKMFMDHYGESEGEEMIRDGLVQACFFYVCVGLLRSSFCDFQWERNRQDIDVTLISFDHGTYGYTMICCSFEWFGALSWCYPL